jgi:RNA polymerase sigma-70 factor (ECF subfamily)
MSAPYSRQERLESGSPQFTTTHWSVVLAASDEKSPAAQVALEQLCRTYWYPLYAHARRRGHDHHSAEDSTQEFFARLLDHEWLKAVGPEKGRFRTFLLKALDHFMANEWRRTRALRRGGGQQIVSLEETRAGEERFAREPAGESAPERAFDRLWATTVLERALTQLQEEFSGRAKVAHFEDWKQFLSREATTQDCEASGQRLGMSAGAVTVAVHRFRERYGDLLRETVSQTVAQAADVDEELHYLFALLNE